MTPTFVIILGVFLTFAAILMLRDQINGGGN